MHLVNNSALFVVLKKNLLIHYQNLDGRNRLDLSNQIRAKNKLSSFMKAKRNELQQILLLRIPKKRKKNQKQNKVNINNQQ